VSDAHEDRRRLSEQALVLRAQAGDRAAFHELVEQYQRRLTYYVHRLVGDVEQARDLLQEIWLEVFRRLGGLESPGAFRVWIYRVAHHRAVKHLRRKSVEARAREKIAGTIDEETVDDERELLENAELVHHALAQLSFEHREALTLRFLEGMTIGEIAEVAQCSEGTAKSRLHYAKAAMRQIIEKEQAHG
jgi:RNA polymerase sigma-70 factor, ECF subfamily